jgi:hypothetical protein
MQKIYRKPSIKRRMSLAQVTADLVKLISGFTAKDDQ